jgi:hypothetical protein
VGFGASSGAFITRVLVAIGVLGCGFLVVGC